MTAADHLPEPAGMSPAMHDSGDAARPRGALALAFVLYALTIVLLPLGRLASTDRLGPRVQLGDAVFALAALAWGWGLWRGQVRFPRGSYLFGLFAYGAAAALSCWFAPAKVAGGLAHLAGLGYLGLLLVMTASLAGRSRERLFILKTWVASAGTVGVLGILSVLLFYLGVRDRSVNVFLWNYGSIPVGSYPRITGFFPNANMFCNYLIVSIAAGAALWPSTRGLGRRLLGVGLVGMGVSSVFTLSAGFGGLALGAATVWIVWQVGRGRATWWREGAVGAIAAGVAIAFIILSVFLMVPAGAGDVALGPVDLQLQTSGRVATWTAAWRVFLEHPLLGGGLGSGVTVSHPRALVPMEHWGTAAMEVAKVGTMEAHHIALGILSQMGALGLVGFVALLGALLRGLLPLGDRSAGGMGERWRRLCLLGGGIGAIVYQGLFGSFEEARHLWWLLGLVAAEGMRSRA